MEAQPLSLIKKLTFALFMLVLGFALFEGLLRIFGFQYQEETSVSTKRKILWARKGLMQDPTLPWSWIPNPGAICFVGGHQNFRFNHLGFRGPVFQERKPEHVLRIVCMGDSCTLGWGVSDQENYCYLLSDFLQHRFKNRIETINAGVVGYTSAQGLYQLRTRILQLKPDLLIVSYNWNDHAPAISMESMRPGNNSRSDKELTRISFAYRLRQIVSPLRIFQFVHLAMEKALIGRNADRSIENVLEPGSMHTIPDTLRVPLSDYAENMKTIAKISSKYHAVPILMTQPFLETSDPDPFLRYRESKQVQYNAALIELAAKEGLYCIDASALFVGHQPRKLFSSRVHPTAEGHRLIAKHLAGAIKNLQEWSQYRQ